MTTLHDRLTELADEAPAGGPAPELWDRGRRLHRRRRAGTVVIVAVAALLLGILGTTSWLRERQQPAPAGASEGLRLPDEFFVPGEFTDGTDDAGELGPLTAVLRAPRHGDRTGLVGIGGSSGIYRFLDLPGWVQDDNVALSTDGSRVAYWYGARSGGLTAPRIDGLAVYDTTTGTIARDPIESDHGLMSQPLVLVGDEVWFEEQPFIDEDREATNGGSVLAWRIGGEHVRTWQPSAGPVPSLVDATTVDGRLVDGATHRVRLWSSDRVEPEVRRTGRSIEAPVQPSPLTGVYVAVLGRDGAAVSASDPRPVVTLAATAPGRFHTNLVPGLETSEVVGWRADTVFVTFDYRTSVFAQVPMDTASAKPLTRLTSDLGDVGLQVAADAWKGPTYGASAPPDPWDPRLVWGAGGAVVLVAAGLVVLWRRRVRA